MSWPLPCRSMGRRSFVCSTRLKVPGLVERCEDRADRRAKSLVLTPRGRRTVDQVERVSQDIRDLVLGEVSDDDLARSLRLLETVRDRLLSLPDAEPDTPTQTDGGPMKFVLRRPVPPLWLLGLFTFSGPVGMHIFVPALPAAAKDLHATPVAHGNDHQSLHSGIGRRSVGLRARLGSLWPPAGASCRPFAIHDRQRRRRSLLRMSIRSSWRASSRRSADARGWCSRAPSSATRLRRTRRRGASRSPICL